MQTRRDPKTGAVIYIKSAEDIEKQRVNKNIKDLQFKCGNIEIRLNKIEERLLAIETLLADINVGEK